MENNPSRHEDMKSINRKQSVNIAEAILKLSDNKENLKELDQIAVSLVRLDKESTPVSFVDLQAYLGFLIDELEGRDNDFTRRMAKEYREEIEEQVKEARDQNKILYQHETVVEIFKNRNEALEALEDEEVNSLKDVYSLEGSESEIYQHVNQKLKENPDLKERIETALIKIADFYEVEGSLRDDLLFEDAD